MTAKKCTKIPNACAKLLFCLSKGPSTRIRFCLKTDIVLLRFSLLPHSLLGTLSKDVFERRTSTGSEAFPLFICLDANRLVSLSFFSLLKTIYPRVSTKPLPNDAKGPLPVDVRRSKTLLPKLPNAVKTVNENAPLSGDF